MTLLASRKLADRSGALLELVIGDRDGVLLNGLSDAGDGVGKLELIFRAQPVADSTPLR